MQYAHRCCTCCDKKYVEYWNKLFAWHRHVTQMCAEKYMIEVANSLKSIRSTSWIEYSWIEVLKWKWNSFVFGLLDWFFILFLLSIIFDSDGKSGLSWYFVYLACFIRFLFFDKKWFCFMYYETIICCVFTVLIWVYSPIMCLFA